MKITLSRARVTGGFEPRLHGIRDGTRAGRWRAPRLDRRAKPGAGSVELRLPPSWTYIGHAPVRLSPYQAYASSISSKSVSTRVTRSPSPSNRPQHSRGASTRACAMTSSHSACGRTSRSRACSAAGHRRNDHDLAPVRDRGACAAFRARVVVADVHVHVGADRARFVENARTETRMPPIDVGDQVRERSAARLQFCLPASRVTKRTGQAHGHRHDVTPKRCPSDDLQRPLLGPSLAWSPRCGPCHRRRSALRTCR